MKLQATTFIVFMAIILLLAGATVVFMAPSFGELKVMYSGSSTAQRMGYSYLLFNGKEHAFLQAEAGQTLTVSTKATVKLGNLTLTIEDFNGAAVYESSFPEEPDQATVELTAPGRYKVIVEGSFTSGGYAVTWSLS